jgi:hypothetical protein
MLYHRTLPRDRSQLGRPLPERPVPLSSPCQVRVQLRCRVRAARQPIRSAAMARCMLHGACCMYGVRCMVCVACCTLHVAVWCARCMFYAAYCMLYVVCCVLALRMQQRASQGPFERSLATLPRTEVQPMAERRGKGRSARTVCMCRRGGRNCGQRRRRTASPHRLTPIPTYAHFHLRPFPLTPISTYAHFHLRPFPFTPIPIYTFFHFRYWGRLLASAFHMRQPTYTISGACLLAHATSNTPETMVEAPTRLYHRRGMPPRSVAGFCIRACACVAVADHTHRALLSSAAKGAAVREPQARQPRGLRHVRGRHATCRATHTVATNIPSGLSAPMIDL